MSHQPTTKPNIGVLLVNVGTPDAPTPPAVRAYLRQLLWEPRMVEKSRFFWWFILHGFILPIRPKKSAAIYRKIWTDEGSPLLINSVKQAAKLTARLNAQHDAEFSVEVGMCVGKPSIAEALESLRKKGAQGLLVLPLFPQYNSAASGGAFDAAFSVLGRWRVVPQLRTVNGFHDHPGYINAVVGQIKEYWEKNNRGNKLVLSFHGLPRDCVTKGDPYAAQCCTTAELIAKGLGIGKDEYVMAFQSRFGPGEWLRPYTEEVLKELAKSGNGVVDVVCPGFAADCVETLYEIAILGRDNFVKCGGKDLRYIPVLNDSDSFIEALSNIVGTVVK